MNAKHRMDGSRGRLIAGTGRAFTLIELLVVVSIIALLISILLPSLKRAREQAKLTVCLTALKGISTASLTYAADDPGEQAIPLQYMVALEPDPLGQRMVLAYAYGGKSGRGREFGNIYWWGTKQEKGPASRPLNRFLYKEGFVDYTKNPGAGFKNCKSDEKIKMDAFLCPSDSGYKGIHFTTWKDSKLSSYDHYGNSYASNVMWVSAGPFCESIGAALRPVSRIVNPANTLYYEENVGRFTFLAEPAGIPGNCSNAGATIPGIVGGWHGSDWMFAVSFVDGHSAFLKMQGYEDPHLSEYPERDYNYWCGVITRGPGFQRDTLPAPTVLTTIPFSTIRGSVE